MTQLKKLACIAFHPLIVLFKRYKSYLFSCFYSPFSLLGKSTPTCELIRFVHGDSWYFLSIVNQGRIYTDQTCNISVISQNSLVAYVSWQYHYGKVLDDKDNYSLTGNVLFDTAPLRISGTLISMLSGGSGLYNYYHWLFDVLPRLFLVKSLMSLDSRIVSYYIPSLEHGFQRETLLILGIKANQCLLSTSSRHIKADSLIAVSHPNPEPHDNQGWIINQLRESFLGVSNFPTLKSSSYCIYISRSDAAHQRTLVNEAEFLDILEPFGFQRVLLSTLTFQEQVSLFANARIIVGVHGAGFANLAFASKAAIVFELFSDCYQPDMYEKIAAHNDLEYHKIVCEVCPNQQSQIADICIPSLQIDAVLQRLSQLSFFQTCE